jgi:hypothetical protein
LSDLLYSEKTKITMRVVTNEQRIKRNRRQSTVLFFVSLAILLGGMIINTLAINTLLIFVIPFVVIPLGLLATLASVRMTNKYIRLPHPEDVIEGGLKGINRRSVLYNYLEPADHILLTPEGVYTLTTRFQITKATVNGEDWKDSRRKGPLGPFFLFMRQEGLGKPFEEANKQAARVQSLIDSINPPINPPVTVQPVVVWTTSKAVLDLKNPALPVVFADAEKKPNLKKLLREEKKERRKQGQTPKAEVPSVGMSDTHMNTIHEALMATPGEKSIREDEAE